MGWPLKSASNEVLLPCAWKARGIAHTSFAKEILSIAILTTLTVPLSFDLVTKGKPKALQSRAALLNHFPSLVTLFPAEGQQGYRTQPQPNQPIRPTLSTQTAGAEANVFPSHPLGSPDSVALSPRGPSQPRSPHPLEVLARRMQASVSGGAEACCAGRTLSAELLSGGTRPTPPSSRNARSVPPPQSLCELRQWRCRCAAGCGCRRLRRRTSRQRSSASAGA